MTQFSEDGKYFAQISTDGKLKIWNTVSNSFEQEFTPDFHLTSPCTCLHFLRHDVVVSNKSSPSPKKKKKKTDPSLQPNIVLGTSSGLLLVYSISKANIDITIDSKTNTSVNCLSITDGSVIYSGADKNIFEWNLKKKTVKSQWKAGNETISAILVIPDKSQLLTASKNIKLWDILSKEVLRTFTGHSSDVIYLYYVNPGSEEEYFLSGSKGDRLLSCWSLTSSDRQKSAVCNYLMEDVVQNVSVNVTEEGHTTVAATVRSGVTHCYLHKLNGKCDKPVKPKSTIQVVSDSHETVKPIKIFGATFRDEDTLCIGHGSEILLTFENVTIATSQKVQCLIRKDPHDSTKTSKFGEVTKTKTPLITDDVHYVSQHTPSQPTKRKTDGKLEIPMEERLENLTLNKSESKVPKSDNVAQLLIQGLHSKDRSMLRSALIRKDENIIRNTIKRLPVTVFESFINEVSNLVLGKTMWSHFGALWLKNFAQIHAGVLISNPSLADMFSKTLGSIQSRTSLQTPLNRLRGKLELLVPQINGRVEDNEGGDEALLVFKDKDSSDSEVDDQDDEMQVDNTDQSESDLENEWEEESLDENNGHESGSSDSDSVIMLPSD